MSPDPAHRGERRGRLPEDRPDAGRLGARVHRHVDWLRRDGVSRMVEEDDLDPRERLRGAVAARRWRRAHPRGPGQARAVLVVGVQRSGTNMIVHGVERDPSVQVHNENDRRAFDRFQLRSDADIRALVASSRHALVLLKPLCDSHRTAELLDGVLAGAGPTPRAVWVYRGVDGRVRSAVHKFGDVNRRVLTEIAAGRGGGRWQAQGLSEDSLELVRSLQPERLSAESAAALFWCVRNQLCLEQGLDRRLDVHLVNYERVVADPESEIGGLARFLGLDEAPDLWDHVDRRAARVTPLDLDPRVRRVCDELEADLGIAAERSFQRVAHRRAT